MTKTRNDRNPTNKATTAAMADFSKKESRMLGLSLHGWENAMVVFLIIAGLFALLAGAATWSVVRLQRVEIEQARQELDKYKIFVEEKVADAKKEGIEAGKIAGSAMVRAAELAKEAAEAQSVAASAMERAADLTRQTEELRSQNLKLENQIQPRRFTPDQLSAIIPSLRSLTGRHVRVSSYEPHGSVFGAV